MIVREISDELTLRAEEVGTSKAMVNVDHIEKERWVTLWLITTGMLSVRGCTKASKEKTGRVKRCVQRNEQGCGSDRSPESKSPLENEGSQGCRRRILRSHA